MKIFIVSFAVLFLFSCSSVPVGSPPILGKEPASAAPVSQTPSTASGGIKKESTQKPLIQSQIFPKLSDLEIEQQIQNTIPSSFAPVMETGNHIKIIYHDLDNNGYKDAFLLVIKKQKGVKADIHSLSDVSGLADKARPPVDYFISVYLQNKGEMISMYRIPIGSRKVLSSFQPYFLTRGKQSPFGLKISFLTTNGTEGEWIFFSSYNRFSFFTTRDTASIKYEISDIDNDGTLDFIEWKHGLEEGTGYETYLTWYRWNGREFREKSETNIVRNLNIFLAAAARQILQKQWKLFFTHLAAKDRRAVSPSRMNSRALFSRIFIPSGSSENKEKLEECSNFRSVVFPKIFENPFSIQSPYMKEITLMARFECDNGIEFIRTVKIALNKNPFGSEEYFFILN